MSTTLSYPVTDFLIGSTNTVRLEHKTVTPLQSGTLERGSVLANNGDGTFSALAKTAVASSSMSVSSHAITISAQNVDASTIEVEKSGTALVLDTDYTVALDDATGYTVITLKSTSSYYSEAALDVAYSTTNVQDAEVILAEDVPEGNSNVTAPVYVSGDFIVQGLKLASGITLSEAGKKSLKDAGIYLVNGIEA